MTYSTLFCLEFALWMDLSNPFFYKLFSEYYSGILCQVIPTKLLKLLVPCFITLVFQARVEVDGSIITSQGPATTFEFALALVRKLVGRTLFI